MTAIFSTVQTGRRGLGAVVLCTFLCWMALAGRCAPVAGAGWFDLEGKSADPFQEGGRSLFVLVFVRIECPVANAYAPEIQRLAQEFGPRGVAFRLVFPDADDSAAAIRQHLQEFGYRLPALRDPRHELARAAKVHTTPEAAVYDAKRRLLYHGRIDDRYVDFGKARPAPEHRDLATALDRLLSGKPAPPSAGAAVGCLIE